MAPKSNNDTLIWVVLGIGGLYLLSQNDDDSKKTVSITVNTPGQDFGGGRVGGEEDTTMEEGEPEPSPPSFEDEGKLKKSGELKQQHEETQRLRGMWVKVVEEVRQLDREVSEVFRRYNSRRGQNLGELGVGMREEMIKRQQQMSTLCAHIERLLAEPGFQGTTQGSDMRIQLRNIRRMAKNFERALNTSDLNTRENTAQLTADVFLRMYVDVARSLRDDHLNRQFLQQDVPEELREFHHSPHDSPMFDVGRPDTRGVSQEDIERLTTTTTFGGKRKKDRVDRDPTDDTREAIGEQENRDQEKPNTDTVLPNRGTGMTGGGMSKKGKGRLRRERDARKNPKKTDLPKVQENFNRAPPEGSTAKKAGAGTTKTIQLDKTIDRADKAIREAVKKGGFDKPVSVRPKPSKTGKGKGKKGKQSITKLAETGGDVESAFRTAGPTLAKTSIPEKQKKVREKKKGTFDSFYGDAIGHAGLMQGQDKDVDAIYKELRLKWENARKQYNVWLDAKDRNAKDEPKHKLVASQALRRIAENEIVLFTFKNPHQNKLYRVAKLYYDKGHHEPSGRSIAAAVIEFKKPPSNFKPHNAAAAAVVWAAFTYIWNDLDAWIGQMGGKLPFQLKPDVAISAVRQPRAKKTRTDTQGGN